MAKHGTGHYEDDPNQNIYHIAEELFKIGPGKRFFFFNSLLTSNLVGVNQAIETGLGSFDVQHQTDLMNGQWDSKMQELKGLLSGFQAYESANERQLLKEILADLQKEDPDLYKKFEDVIGENEINYPKFLVLLNSMDTDAQTAYNLIDDMQNTMNEFNNILNEIVAKEAELEHKDEYNYFESHRNEIVTKVRERMGNKSFSEVSKNLASAVDDFLVLTNDYEGDLSKQLDDTIQLMLQSGKSTMPISKTDSKIAQSNAVKLQLLQRIRQCSAALGEDVQDTINIIQQAIVALNNGNPENNDTPEQKRRKEIANNLIKDLKFAKDNYLKLLSQYEQLKKILNTNFLTSRQKSSEQIAGLTKERRARILKTLEDQGKNVEELREIENGFVDKSGRIKKFDIRSKEGFNAYKEILERILNNGEQINSTRLIGMLNILLQKSDKAIRKQTITLVSETNGGLGLRQIKNKFVTLMGSEGLKADSITFFAGRAIVDDPDIDHSKINEIMGEISHDVKKMLPSEIRSYNIETGRKGVSYTVQGDLKATAKLDDEFLKKAKEKIQQKEKIKKVLENTIIIEKSIKFADTFSKLEGGFHGGSLGANLDDALNNINNMIELGGITPIEDKEFLVSAIMNAGPGMLGSKQKGALEMYLGAIASACMFTSGGDAIRQYYLQTLNQLGGESLNSTKKIHIFVLGTRYFPLSFILKLVKNGIEECINILSEYTAYDNQGAHVVIHNPVNEASDKISNLFITNDDPPREIRIGDWGKTAEAGFPKVTIEMGILAGFLDILEEIKNTLKELFL